MNIASIEQHYEFNEFVMKQDGSVTSAKEVEDKLSVTYFITSEDPHHFSGLWEHVSNSTLLGGDEYPGTIAGAYDLLYVTTKVVRNKHPMIHQLMRHLHKSVKPVIINLR